MVLVDPDAIWDAAERSSCGSPEALKNKFGGGHETWRRLLMGGPVRRKFFERACAHLNLDPLEVEVHPLFDQDAVTRGLELSISRPTVFDFRSQYDARPEAAMPGKHGGKGKKTVEAPGNRLFLLFSYLELHAVNGDNDIFVESVRLNVEIEGESQLFHPYRWCNISGANNSRTNPKGYWLAEAMEKPAWATKAGPEGFHLGKHGPHSIKEECSFVAIARGNLQLYGELLDLLTSAGLKGKVICTLIVKFRHGDAQVLRQAAKVITFPLEHLQKSRAAYEEEQGYAATLPAITNL